MLLIVITVVVRASGKDDYQHSQVKCFHRELPYASHCPKLCRTKIGNIQARNTIDKDIKIGMAITLNGINHGESHQHFSTK